MSGTATPSRREGAFGVERIAAGADGKAVRLADVVRLRVYVPDRADVVRWLMEEWQTGRADAVANHLLPKLKGEAPQLYLLQQGGFARGADEIEWFASGRAGRRLGGLSLLALIWTAGRGLLLTAERRRAWARALLAPCDGFSSHGRILATPMPR